MYVCACVYVGVHVRRCVCMHMCVCMDDICTHAHTHKYFCKYLHVQTTTKCSWCICVYHCEHIFKSKLHSSLKAHFCFHSPLTTHSPLLSRHNTSTTNHPGKCIQFRLDILCNRQVLFRPYSVGKAPLSDPRKGRREEGGPRSLSFLRKEEDCLCGR